MTLKNLTDEIRGIIKRRIKTPLIVRRINKSNDLVRLVVGAGNNPVEGGYNFDIRSRSPQVYYLDVTNKFPFCNESIDLILCEHLIEHLSFDEGQHMLGEFYRILKNKGKVRVSTPDLAKVISLYGREEGIEGDYIKWISDFVSELKTNVRNSYQFVINNAFHQWDHKFLYDEPLLRKCIEEKGFIRTKRFNYGESDCKHFNGVELHGEVVKNDRMVNFESLILEATK